VTALPYTRSATAIQAYTSSCVIVTRSFHYSTFLLLDVSSPWLLLAVSLTRHFLLLAITQRFQYSTYPLNDITRNFTQTFHYPTFQLLDVSALPFNYVYMHKYIHCKRKKIKGCQNQSSNLQLILLIHAMSWESKYFENVFYRVGEKTGPFLNVDNF